MQSSQPKNVFQPWNHVTVQLYTLGDPQSSHLRYATTKSKTCKLDLEDTRHARCKLYDLDLKKEITDFPFLIGNIHYHEAFNR